MKQQLQDIAQSCMDGANSGDMMFPEIVQTLITAGFEGYLTDFRRQPLSTLASRRRYRQETPEGRHPAQSVARSAAQPRRFGLIQARCFLFGITPFSGFVRPVIHATVRVPPALVATI